MSQKNMSQIIVYKNQEELRSDIEEMIKEVKDIERLIKVKEKEFNSLAYNLNIDSARSVTASVRRGMPGSYDVSEKAKKDLSELHTDIKNMKNEAAAIRISIKEKENDLRNVKNAATSDTARGKSPISNNTYFSKPFVIINKMSPKDVKKNIFINNLDQRSSVASLKAINDRKQLDHMQSVNTLFAATKASSSATRASSSKSSSASRALSPASGGASSSVSRASSSKSSSATRALSPAARRASSSSSKTGGLRKRRGKNLDNTKTRK
jgi:hypothetical protein